MYSGTMFKKTNILWGISHFLYVVGFVGMFECKFLLQTLVNVWDISDW